MQHNSHFAMVSPAPGFTVRVMTRLAERERARVRRRTLIGSALLVGAAGAMLVFGVIQLMPAIWVLITNPDVIVTLLSAFESVAFWVGTVVDAFWIAASVIVENLDPSKMVLSAVMVFALMMLWTRVVVGSFQIHLSLNHVGG